MGDASREIKRCARVEHFCSWCGEIITPKTIYNSWTWFDNASAWPIKMHMECYDAYRDSDNNGFCEGENPRGCNCGCDRNCPRCHGDGVLAYITDEELSQKLRSEFEEINND